MTHTKRRLLQGGGGGEAIGIKVISIVVGERKEKW